MPFTNEINPGQRAVDTQQTLMTAVPNFSVGSALTGVIDCTQAVSFNLSMFLGCAVFAQCPGNMRFVIAWYGIDGTTVVDVATYEFTAYSNTVSRWSFLSDRCRGSYAQVWVTALNTLAVSAGNTQSVITNCAINFSTSSKIIDRQRIIEYTNAPPFSELAPGLLPVYSSDGSLMHLGQLPLPASSNSNVLWTPPCSSDIFISIVGTSATCRLRGGFGWGAGPPQAATSNNISFTLVTTAFPASSVSTPSQIFGPFASMPMPFVFQITNLAATAGTIGVDIWNAIN